MSNVEKPADLLKERADQAARMAAIRKKLSLKQELTDEEFMSIPYATVSIPMSLVVSNDFAACSTLMIKQFNYSLGCPYHGNWSGDERLVWDGCFFATDRIARAIQYDEFIEDMKKAVALFGSGPMTGVPTPTNFAHVMASVEGCQGLAAKYLTRMGFNKTKAVWNAKNNTTVELYFMTVPEFFSALFGEESKSFINLLDRKDWSGSSNTMKKLSEELAKEAIACAA